ncbi:MAG: hypothetical protein R2809_12115 [Flavobacteriales bacterium]
MEKTTRFLIHFWLAVSIASAIFAGYMIAVHGWEVGSSYLFVPVIAFIWYLFRKMMHNRLTKQNDNANRNM